MDSWSRGSSSRVVVLVATLVVMVCAAVVSPAIAEATDSEAQERKADFLFGEPRVHAGVRGGWLFTTENSDIFGFFGDILTVESGDFSAPTIGFDIGLRVHPRVDVIFGFDYSRRSVASEYRDFVEDNDLPILQETRLRSAPVTGSVKLSLVPRGRAISRYAFVPRTVVPYVGGGAGVIWYRLEQGGDFVDFVDLSIFSGRFDSSGWGLTYHAFGGVDVRVHPRVFLSFEARYLWADAGLGTDFIDFEPIDLSGLRSTVALNLIM